MTSTNIDTSVAASKNSNTENTAKSSKQEDSDSDDSNTNENNNCLRCKKKEIVYSCVPCGCKAFCKSCAMKMATGGKCKLCGEMYSELRKL